MGINRDTYKVNNAANNNADLTKQMVWSSNADEGTLQYAMEDVPHAVAEATGDIPAVRWISMNTDPWNMVFPSSGQER